jgi:hypothetical protein
MNRLRSTVKNQTPLLDFPDALAGKRHTRQTTAHRTIIAALVATFILSGSALAMCSLPDVGRWVNVKPGGDPEQIEIYFTECGDTEGSETRLGAKVFVRQSSGGLYQRPPVSVAFITDKGTEWMLAKVPTGGYLDKIWMRRVRVGNQEFLRVLIKHQSLDSKPSATSSYTYRRAK